MSLPGHLEHILSLAGANTWCPESVRTQAQATVTSASDWAHRYRIRPAPHQIASGRPLEWPGDGSRVRTVTVVACSEGRMQDGIELGDRNRGQALHHNVRGTGWMIIVHHTHV